MGYVGTEKKSLKRLWGHSERQEVGDCRFVEWEVLKEEKRESMQYASMVKTSRPDLRTSSGHRLRGKF